MSISEHSPDMRLRDSDVSFRDNGTNTNSECDLLSVSLQGKSVMSEFVPGMMLYSNEDIITG